MRKFPIERMFVSFSYAYRMLVCITQIAKLLKKMRNYPLSSLCQFRILYRFFIFAIRTFVEQQWGNHFESLNCLQFREGDIYKVQN